MVVQDKGGPRYEPQPHERANATNSSVREIHIAVIGANGSGKSALTVKYITKRYISEYDPNLEDTYCKHETINGQECMLWIMDTVEGPHRDPNRYICWADVIFVVYSITNRFSLDYAERLLRTIAQHDHSICTRQHSVLLIGNKTDLDRYRQVSKSQGTLLATTYNAEFFETNTTEEYVLVKTVFHHALNDIMARIPACPAATPAFDDKEHLKSPALKNKKKLQKNLADFDDPPSPKYGSDPEQITKRNSTNARSQKRSWVSSGTPSPKSSLPRRSKSPSSLLHDVVFHRDRQQSNRSNTLPPPKKSNSALKLLQLFK